MFVAKVCILVALLATVYGGKATEKCNDYIKIIKEKSGVDKNIELPKIVSTNGKVPAYPGEFPHMAQLLYGEKEEALCGGILIGDQYVLTTAVCAKPPKGRTDLKYVLLGKYKTDGPQDHVQKYKVAEIHVHPQYAKYLNDIALVKLEKKVTFTKYVLPVCLHTTDKIDADHVIATGWGQLGSEPAGTSTLLMKLVMSVYTAEECSAAFSQQFKNGVAPSHLCVGGRKEYASTGAGDSGGPVQIIKSENPNVYEIVGITSFGKSCRSNCQIGPEVSTRVSSFIPWIESIVWP